MLVGIISCFVITLAIISTIFALNQISAPKPTSNCPTSSSVETSKTPDEYNVQVIGNTLHILNSNQILSSATYTEEKRSENLLFPRFLTASDQKNGFFVWLDITPMGCTGPNDFSDCDKYASILGTEFKNYGGVYFMVNKELHRLIPGINDNMQLIQVSVKSLSNNMYEISINSTSLNQEGKVNQVYTFNSETLNILPANL
jgi:hypothetical protein